MVGKEAAALRRPRGIVSVVVAVTACVALAVVVDPALGLGGLVLLLAGGGLVRLLLPSRWLPGLAVRSRVVDAATLLVLAAVLAVLAASLPRL